MPTPIHFSPPSTTMGPGDRHRLRFDVSAWAEGLDIGDVTPTLRRLDTGESYDDGLIDDPVVVDEMITVPVGDLVAGATYRLSVTFPAGAEEVWTGLLDIRCVQ